MAENAGIVMSSANAASGAAGAVSEYRTGEQNQRIANMNAGLADQQAKDAIARGTVAELQLRRNTRRLIGSQRASAAASGVVVDSGTAGAIVSDTQMLAEQDAETIRNNAAREAWGYKVQAQDYRYKGQLAMKEGKDQAWGTILTSGAKLYGSGYKQKGSATIPKQEPEKVWF